MSIYSKINGVMQAVRGVEKTGKNKHGGYKYAGHEAVTDALRDYFQKFGIVREASMTECDVLEGGAIKVKVKVTYTDIEDGSRVACDMYAVQHCQTKSGAITAQQVGQALSYAVKNVEFKLFALTGDTERDSDETDPNGPADEQPSESAHDAGGERTSSGNKSRANELLKMFELAKTEAEVLDVNKMFKTEWKGSLEHVPNLAEAVVAARNIALERVKAAK